MLNAISFAIVLTQPLPFLAPSSDDSTDTARAIITKAIQARGGAEKLVQYPAVTWRSTGKLFLNGKPVAYTGEFAGELPKRDRAEMKFEDGEKTRRVIVVTTGEQGWEIVDGRLTDLTKADLAEERERAYAEWVQTLRPLVKGEGFTLSSLQEREIDGQPAVGVRVSSTGHRDLKLYFRKESSLLVKADSTCVDVDSGKEFTYEVFYEAYKEFGGLKFHTRRKAKKDGKLFSETEASDFKPMERLDDKLFAKP
jgi:hypothetical protein